jgi:hypothetical protein
MKKVFLLSIFLFFALVVNSQNFDKEAVLNYVKNGNVYNCEILQDMGIVQQFPFGTLATDEQLIKYKEGKPRKIKNKLLKGEIKYYVNDVVYSIAIHCNDYQKVKKFLDAKIGKSRTVKYVRFEPYVSWADEYVYDIQDQYYISIRDNGLFSIYALDFMTNTNKYDEFSQVGVSYFDFNNMFNLQGDDKIYFKPAYTYKKKEGYNQLIFKIDYFGKDWMFLNKVDFLLDDNTLISYNIEPHRKVEDKFMGGVCAERSNLFVEERDWNRILNSKSTKIRFYGEEFNATFDLNPIQVYAMKVALYYKNKNMFLN